MRYPALRDAVIERIQAGWSPQQIAGRLKLEMAITDQRATNPKHGIVPLCHETIYRFVHSPFGQSLHLWRALPERRRQRRPRHARKRYGRRFGPEVSILHRPESVAKRKQFGHWEADLIQFRKKFGNANLTSLVERVSRFTVLSRNNDRQSRPIMEGLIRVLQSLPVTCASVNHVRPWHGVYSRQASVPRPGFAIRSHLGRKARSKTPIDAFGHGSHATSIH